MTIMATVIAFDNRQPDRLYCHIQYLRDGTRLAQSCALEGVPPMIDSNVEQYVREHQERVQRLDDL